MRILYLALHLPDQDIASKWVMVCGEHNVLRGNLHLHVEQLQLKPPIFVPIYIIKTSSQILRLYAGIAQAYTLISHTLLIRPKSILLRLVRSMACAHLRAPRR